MALSVGSGGDDEVIASINTTPLVDVMLVLLIIFLITIPVVTASVPVRLPQARNTVREAKPEQIVLSVDADGALYWFDTRLSGADALLERLKPLAARQPPPEVHIRGDQESRYEMVGRLVVACQRAGIAKVGFITEPPPNN